MTSHLLMLFPCICKMSFSPLTVPLSHLMQSTVLVDIIHLSSHLDCPRESADGIPCSLSNLGHGGFPVAFHFQSKDTSACGCHLCVDSLEPRAGSVWGSAWFELASWLHHLLVTLWPVPCCPCGLAPYMPGGGKDSAQLVGLLQG